MKIFFKDKGFTLTELLIIISIIGLLTTFVAVMLNSARIKTKDTNRLATLRLIYNQISILDVDLTCQNSPGGGVYLLNNCTGLVGGEVVNFSKFVDPNANSGYMCHAWMGQGPCAYAIGPDSGSTNPTINNFQVCSWLEGNSSGFPSGLVHIDDTGNIDSGCDLTIS